MAWHNFTRKDVCFQWDDDCDAAFLELKQWLTSMPILVAPRDEGTYVLDSDASTTALETMLQQEQDGQLHIILYATKC